jgi:hypothetical protein
MSSPAGKIQAIHRYPVKGLTPEPLPQATLAVRQTIPCDRMYAIENGPSGFDAAEPGYLPKQRFLMLMRHARLAELRTAFDESSHTLTIRSENREAARGDLRTPEGDAPRSKHSLRNSAPTNCAGRPRCCTRRATAFPTWRGR